MTSLREALRRLLDRMPEPVGDRKTPRDIVNQSFPSDDIEIETLAETEEFFAWSSSEPDGEVIYHIEFGTVTVHFIREDWQQALDLFRQLLAE
jgi:hypothetical protein